MGDTPFYLKPLQGWQLLQALLLGSHSPMMPPVFTTTPPPSKQMHSHIWSLGVHCWLQMLNVYETEYCRPATFVPSGKVPATFTGHSFALTFDSGSCYFNETAYHGEAS